MDVSTVVIVSLIALPAIPPFAGRLLDSSRTRARLRILAAERRASHATRVAALAPSGTGDELG